MIEGSSPFLSENAARVVRCPSPSFTERRGGGRPALVVLHYTAMESGAAAVARLCDPKIEASAHYLIDIDGTVTAMVAEEQRAWHAGASFWGGVQDVNSWSIGIEIANPGHHLGYPPYPEAQMASLEGLLGGIIRRWTISPEGVVAHACIAPGRKIDPGEKLDWRRLARAGLAVWIDPPVARDSVAADLPELMAAAALLGYPVPETPEWSEDMKALWHSLSMRWLAPSPLFGHPPCRAGLRHIQMLAERWPATITGSNG
ncbi:MAG: N-acetylmuramoyl-L-alanine amidase [Pseudomonadota bacterium]